MIWIDGHSVEQQVAGEGPVESMWLDGYLIWQGVRSCFGGGRWLDDKPWLGNDAWKSN